MLALCVHCIYVCVCRSQTDILMCMYLLYIVYTNLYFVTATISLYNILVSYIHLSDIITLVKTKFNDVWQYIIYAFVSVLYHINTYCTFVNVIIKYILYLLNIVLKNQNALKYQIEELFFNLKFAKYIVFNRNDNILLCVNCI